MMRTTGRLAAIRARTRATPGDRPDVQPNPLYDHYYGLIDLGYWLRTHLGKDVAAWVTRNVHPLDLVFRLAEQHGIVLLNGGGFHAPEWSARVSFANLPDEAYGEIGRAIRSIIEEYARTAALSPAAAPITDME